MDFDDLVKLRKKCISHAGRLLKASKSELVGKRSNIAYHLATLALEEVGKAVMIVIGYGYFVGEKGNKLLKQAGEDHVKKLFWALWAPSFGRSDMSVQQIQSFFDMSKKIHSLRMRGLYVDPLASSADPQKVIRRTDAKQLVALTEVRINMEKYSKLEEPSREVRDDFLWFHSAVEEPRNKRLIFGKKSIDKLTEFKGNSKKWIRWLHEQFDEAERQSQELLRQEIKRKTLPSKKSMADKWKIKFILITPSHSIRQRTLNDWNSKIPMIQFSIGKKTSKTRELIVNMILPKSIPINGLWYLSWGQARLLAISLSIAARGYFWWYLPEDVSKFYEKIIDLDSNAEVAINRQPALTLDWGNNLLSIGDLNRSVMCYRFLPKDNVKFLNCYVAGISFMGKSDIHTPFEREIYLQFYHSLLHAMIFYGDHKDGVSFIKSFSSIFKIILNMEIAEDLLEHIKIAQDLMSRKKTSKTITLSECASMKLLCDVYIFYRIDKMAQADMKRSKLEK